MATITKSATTDTPNRQRHAGVTDENALGVLSRQHQEIRDLFELVRSPHLDRQVIWKELFEHVAAHVAVERTFVYPIIRRQNGLDQLRDSLRRDYNRMRHLLVLIERRPIGAWEMPVLLTQLLDSFRDHQDRCTQILLPTLSDRLTQTQLDDIGAKMVHAERVILADFHPHMLSLGPVYRWNIRNAPTWRGNFRLTRPRPWLRP
jgi:hypothetical protein